MTDPTALPTFGFETPPAQSLHERVHSTLQNMGANPEVDDDGDIRVQVEQQLLFIRTIEGDLPFMRIFGQWQVSEEITAPLEEQLLLASRMTTMLNLVKMAIHEPEADAAPDGPGRLIIAATDIIVTRDTPLDQVLANCLVGIMNAVQTWHRAASGTPLEQAMAEQAQAAEEARLQAMQQNGQSPDAGN